MNILVTPELFFRAVSAALSFGKKSRAKRSEFGELLERLYLGFKLSVHCDLKLSFLCVYSRITSCNNYGAFESVGVHVLRDTAKINIYCFIEIIIIKNAHRARTRFF